MTTEGSQPADRRQPNRETSGSAARFFLGPQDAEKALEQLRLLCSSPEASPQALEAATERLRDAGYKQEASHILHRALTEPNANPHVGAIWIRRAVSRRRWDGTYPKHMDKLARRSEVGKRAVIEFLQAVGHRGMAHQVGRVFKRHGRWLRTHPLGWPTGLRALANVGWYGKLIGWASNWRHRPEMEPDLLFWLALAMRSEGKEKQAHEVVRRALPKPADVNHGRILRLWYAFEEAMAGHTNEALDQIKDFEPARWDEYSGSLYYLIRGVIRVQEAEGDQRQVAFERDYRRIRERFRITRVHRCSPLVRREYRRAVSRMAKDSGNFTRAIQATWQSADNGFLLLPLLIIPPLQILAPLYLFRLTVRPRLQLPASAHPGAPPT